MPDTPSSSNELSATVHGVNMMVTGESVTAGADRAAAATPGAKHAGLPVIQGAGMASQAVAQSMAIAVQDAVDLMRNISTIETTAIGTATAKWIAEPENPFYPVIITHSTATLTEISVLMEKIGMSTAKILSAYETMAQGTKP